MLKAGSWYLNRPANGTDGAENVGCNWNVHVIINSTFVDGLYNSSVWTMLIRRVINPELSIRLAAFCASIRYHGYFRKAEIFRCKQHELTVLLSWTTLSHEYQK